MDIPGKCSSLAFLIKQDKNMKLHPRIAFTTKRLRILRYFLMYALCDKATPWLATYVSCGSALSHRTCALVNKH